MWYNVARTHTYLMGDGDDMLHEIGGSRIEYILANWNAFCEGRRLKSCLSPLGIETKVVNHPMCVLVLFEIMLIPIGD